MFRVLITIGRRGGYECSDCRGSGKKREFVADAAPYVAYTPPPFASVNIGPRAYTKEDAEKKGRHGKLAWIGLAVVGALFFASAFGDWGCTGSTSSRCYSMTHGIPLSADPNRNEFVSTHLLSAAQSCGMAVVSCWTMLLVLGFPFAIIPGPFLAVATDANKLVLLARRAWLLISILLILVVFLCGIAAIACNIRFSLENGFSKGAYKTSYLKRGKLLVFGVEG